MLQVNMFTKNFSFCQEENSNYISYIYTSERQNYLFEDTEMDQFSFLPPFELNGKKVVFTINQQLALFYDNTFIYSISEILKKIQFPQTINQELLDKIATITNYLSQGKEYEYLKGTAKQQEDGISFLVKKGTCCCKAYLSFSTELNPICYKLSEEILVSN